MGIVSPKGQGYAPETGGSKAKKAAVHLLNPRAHRGCTGRKKSGYCSKIHQKQHKKMTANGAKLVNSQVVHPTGFEPVAF